MSKATYSEIGGPDGHLANRRPFEGNSMSAYWSVWLGYKVYRVFSYTTQIAESSPAALLLNEDQYSVTTSRHQNLCRAWLS